jgi:DNA-directed RNA polymerase specialized sigma24 family protein
MTREKQQGWLYRIATNACLDFLDRRRDRTPIPTDRQDAGGTGTEVLYLQPWPDSQPEDPQERAVARETIELAFMTGSAEPRWPTASRQWRCTCDVPGLRRMKPMDVLRIENA